MDAEEPPSNAWTSTPPIDIAILGALLNFVAGIMQVSLSA
jgi:hypothetical protein